MYALPTSKKYIPSTLYINPIIMKKNMGTADRFIRIIVAAVIAGLFYAEVIPQTWWGWLLLVFAAIFLLTSFISFCPLYLPFGLNTIRKKLSK